MSNKKSLTPEEEELRALKLQKLSMMEKKIELQEGLPFLHGWNWYPWAREFFESTNKMNFLCAANQISKSSTQIRKCIDWATNKQKWGELWKQKPVQFWYLYPSGNQANAEFLTKWQQFLPQGKYKDDPVYGWKEEKKQGNIYAIHFHSGVHVFFKTYAQETTHLQTGTCDAIFCDEELPMEHFEELLFRLSASDGYFHMVFTATLGQDFWRRVIDPEHHEDEKLPTAAKWTVSMFDCLKYEDGSESHWTTEKIQTVINRCSTHAEVLKRVYGKFILDQGGRKYPQFDIKRHMKAKHPVPKSWHIYGGADVGSGGENGHPSAIIFVAVDPDYRQGRVFLGWRGDGISTTASDVVQKFQEMKKENNLLMSGQYYDWACKDFDTISTRMGEPFIPADKSHEKGEQVLNVLFKNDMLSLYEDPELQKLASELSTLRKETPKNKAIDDFTDALRYAVTRIPWDWTVIQGDLPEGVEAPSTDTRSPVEKDLDERRAAFDTAYAQEEARIEDEFSELNELCGL